MPDHAAVVSRIVLGREYPEELVRTGVCWEPLLLQHVCGQPGQGIELEEEVSQGVEDRTTIPEFDAAQDVRAMPDHDIRARVHDVMGDLLHEGGWSVGVPTAKDALVAVQGYDHHLRIVPCRLDSFEKCR